PSGFLRRPARSCSREDRRIVAGSCSSPVGSCSRTFQPRSRFTCTASTDINRPAVALSPCREQNGKVVCSRAHPSRNKPYFPHVADPIWREFLPISAAEKHLLRRQGVREPGAAAR